MLLSAQIVMRYPEYGLYPLPVPVVKHTSRVLVHLTLDYFHKPLLDRYTITHRISGRAFAHSLPKAEAICYAERLNDLPELDYHANVVCRSPRVRRIAEELRYLEFITRKEMPCHTSTLNSI